MSAPWWLLALVMVLALAGYLLIRVERRLVNNWRLDLGERNMHAQVVYHNAGMRWYPHVMANGDVRWYETTHDPMDI